MQPKYAPEARRHIVTDAFEMLSLTNSAVRKRLNNRASQTAVSLWRSGKRAIPQWAADLLASDMCWKADRLYESAKMLRSIATNGKRGGSHRALTAWQAHRAAQKEKAGE